MPRYYLVGHTFKSGLGIRQVTKYVDGKNPTEACNRLRHKAKHKFYSIDVFAFQDDAERNRPPLTVWLSNHAQAYNALVRLHGHPRHHLYHEPGEFTFNGETHRVPNPLDGSIHEPAPSR
jgi:hypothetical protein